MAALLRIIASQSKDSSPANRRPNTSQSYKGFLHQRNLFVLCCPVIKKTPRIAAWCHSAFLFNVSCSSNSDGIFRIRGLPRGRFQPTTSLAGFASYHLEVLTFRHSETSFLFCGVPLRGALILLGKRHVIERPLVSTCVLGYIFVRLGTQDTFRLHELQGGTTSFGDLRLRSPPGLRLASRLFQRFTARRASVGTTWL